MSTIEVFEPALCCSTGVCGTDVPQELVTFSADLDWLRGRGQDVARFNLASEPAAFAGRPAVLDLLQVSGSEGLPLVLVDGAVAMAGRYPGRAELARWAGVAAEPAPSAVPTPDAPPAPSAVPAPAAVLPLAGGCCGGGSC